MRPFSSLRPFWTGLAILFFAIPLAWIIDRAVKGRWSLWQLFLVIAILAVAIAATAQLFASWKTLGRVKQLSSSARNAVPVSDFERFTTNVSRSGLVNEVAFAEILRPHQATASLDELIGGLIAAGLLTRWQCTNLQNGKWKGFLLDGYKLMDRLDREDFLAEDTATGCRVVLRITMESRTKTSGEIEYKLVHVFR